MGVLALRLVRRADRDNVIDLAAQVAFYFLFALFPFLLFVTTITAYLPLEPAMEKAIVRLSSLLPGAGVTVVRQHLQSVLSEGRPRLLTVGLVVALWSASRGVDSLRTALNLAYNVDERRAWWKLQLLAVAVTVFGALLVLSGIGLLAAGGTAGYWFADRFGFSSGYMTVLSVVRWPITAFMMTVVAVAVYYTLPNVKQQLRFLAPGAVLSTLLWLLVTWGFGEFVSRFESYGATYGSLGGVIILLTWFYLSVLILLFGGELNAVLEHASIEGKASGEKAPGAGVPAPIPGGDVADAKRVAQARS